MKQIIKSIAINIFFGNSFFRKGVHFKKNSFINRHAEIIGGRNIYIGEHSKIGRYSRLCCWEKVLNTNEVHDEENSICNS